VQAHTCAAPTALSATKKKFSEYASGSVVESLNYRHELLTRACLVTALAVVHTREDNTTIDTCLPSDCIGLSACVSTI
jgi:hypothetical protein